MDRRYNPAHLAITLLFLAAGLWSCSGNEEKSAKPTVVVSIGPQKWILERIAGDMVEPLCLMPGEANPENFDPPMSALAGASDATVYMKMGHLPWEDALVSRISEGNSKLTVVDTSEGIDLITGTHDHHHDGEHGHHDEDAADPHTWSSLRNVKIIAANMTAALAAADTANASRYFYNLGVFQAETDALDSLLTARLAPLRGKNIIVWHPSLSYFARDYGLNQIAIGAENKEMSLPQMKRKLDMATGGGAAVFFIQPSIDNATAEKIAEMAGSRTAIFNPLESNISASLKKVAQALTDSIP